MAPPLPTPVADPAPPARWPARRRPAWAPAAAVAATVYAVVQVTWAATGTAVPWKAHSAHPPAVQYALALAALLAGTAACLAPRTRRAHRPVAGVLLGAIPVLGFGMAPLPAYVVTIAAGAGVESATGLVHVLLSTVVTTMLVLAALAHHRRSTGACPDCGQAHVTAEAHAPLLPPAPSIASRRTRRTAFLLTTGLLPWMAVKTVWTLGGDALGITAERWKAAHADDSRAVRALAEVGVDATVLAAGVALFLIAGLLHPWGQRFPRPLPWLGGRRVPRLLPLVPAALTAFGLALYGVLLSVYAPFAALGVLPAPDPDPVIGGTRSGTLWLVAFGGTAFGGLGFALAVAARSYAARTRPRRTPASR